MIRKTLNQTESATGVISTRQTFDSWVEPARLLRSSLRTSTAAQLEIASRIGVKLSKGVPSMVAAARLRRHVADELELDVRGPSSSQFDYLRNLAEDLGTRVPASIGTRDEADAWIRVLHARRALAALRRLRIHQGDVVSPIGEGLDRADEVVSVHASGKLFFRGGRGAGARPHLVEIAARAGATDAKSSAALAKAQNRAAARHRMSGPPSRQRLAALRDFEVRDRPRAETVDGLDDLLVSATDEAPIQKFLSAHPELLGDIRVSSHGTFVVPLPRLGSQYIPDFVIAIADSAGIHYVLVELESPRAPIAIQSGQFATKARQAVSQIEDWREWLKNNLAYAQRDTTADGLGLPEIRPESAGLVLIGRRADPTAPKNEVVRQRLLESSNIAVHSYDWLAENLRPGLRRRHALGPLELELDRKERNPFEFDPFNDFAGESPFPTL